MRGGGGQGGEHGPGDTRTARTYYLAASVAERVVIEVLSLFAIPQRAVGRRVIPG